MIDEAARGRNQWYVQRHELRAAQHLVDADRALGLRRQAPRCIDRDVGVVTEHVHAQLDRRVGDQTADLAEAGNAQRLALQFVAGKGLLAVFDRIGSSAPDCRSSPPTNCNEGAMLRAAVSMPASTNSLTALAVAPGALKTGTPRSLIVLTGMWLVPAPARATGRFGATSSRQRTSLMGR